MMEQFEWNDSFSVGNILMDAHHRIFFEMIKDFSALENKDDHDAIKKRIDFLVEYAAMHLGAEEKLMLAANYPGFDGHKAAHDAFAHKLISIKESFNKDRNSISADDILAIMQDWLISHIVDSDKRYMPYVQKLQV